MQDLPFRWFVEAGLQLEDLCGGAHDCPDHPPAGERCEKCPRVEWDRRKAGNWGCILEGAELIRFSLREGITITLSEINADEFIAMQVIADVVRKLEGEQARAAELEARQAQSHAERSLPRRHS